MPGVNAYAAIQAIPEAVRQCSVPNGIEPYAIAAIIGAAIAITVVTILHHYTKTIPPCK